MHRRSFLALLGLGVAAAAIDPEQLLWVPGKKTIFMPSTQPAYDWSMDHADVDSWTGVEYWYREYTPLGLPDWVTREAILLSKAKMRLLSSIQAERNLRESQVHDMAFYAGGQWPQEIRLKRLDPTVRVLPAPRLTG